ncbi:hypothetical protein QAD02_010414, partial [Eretmocerus hayati]
FAVFAAVAVDLESSTSTTLDTTTTTTTTKAETTMTRMDDPDSQCNCDDRCARSPVIGSGKHPSDVIARPEGLPAVRMDKQTNSSAPEQPPDAGDSRGSICARSRDSVDRTLPSECHMSCLNQCTEYSTTLLERDYKKFVIVAAFRP